MNKDFIKRLTVVAVILTLATASLVAGTFAKYTTEIKGTAEARVAKFAVKAMGANASANAEFKLFDTIKDTSGGTEQNVKVGVGEKIIAPGTQGSFDIVLENDSEVTVKYAIAFTGTSTGTGTEGEVPLEFRVYEKGGAVPESWVNTLTNINIGDETTKLAYKTDSTVTATYTIDWQWPFEVKVSDDPSARDEDDTALGLLAAANATDVKINPTVTATVTFTQVD